MRRVVIMAALLLLAGCANQGSPNSDLRVGRYQFIGKEKFQDGTIEYACLDTATGSIGYATIYPVDDQSRKNLTNFDCSN